MAKTSGKQQKTTNNLTLTNIGIENSIQINAETDVISVPVVMMVEGVHNGSHGMLLHTAETLEQYASDWNGKPVVISHPQDAEGNYISAYSEGVETVGTISNSRVEQGRLKATLKINKEQLRKTQPRLYEQISKKQLVEVSIGAYSEETMETGEWNGISYEGVTTSYIPDHLAILPNKTGACSIEKGCGLRVNEKMSINLNHVGNEMSIKSKLSELIGDNQLLAPIQVNVEQGLQERLQKAQRLVNSMDSDMHYHWLEEVYVDYIVYRRESKINNQQQSTYFKHPYTVNDAGDIELADEPEKVKKQVEFVAYTENGKIKVNVKSNESSAGKKGTNDMNKEKVNLIINCESSRFTECDREYLMALDREVLDKILPIQTNKEVETPEVDVKEVISTYKEDEILAILPELMASKVQAGLNTYAEKRKALIETITTNSQNFTAEELEGMETSMLEKLEKTVTNKTDYSASNPAGVQVNRESTEEVLLPPGVESK